MNKNIRQPSRNTSTFHNDFHDEVLRSLNLFKRFLSPVVFMCLTAVVICAVRLGPRKVLLEIYAHSTLGLTSPNEHKDEPSAEGSFFYYFNLQRADFKSSFVRASRSMLSLCRPRSSLCLYALLIGVFMIATQLIKRLTLVTLILTRAWAVI